MDNDSRESSDTKVALSDKDLEEIETTLREIDARPGRWAIALLKLDVEKLLAEVKRLRANDTRVA